MTVFLYTSVKGYFCSLLLSNIIVYLSFLQISDLTLSFSLCLPYPLHFLFVLVSEIYLSVVFFDRGHCLYLLVCWSFLQSFWLLRFWFWLSFFVWPWKIRFVNSLLVLICYTSQMFLYYFICTLFFVKVFEFLPFGSSTYLKVSYLFIGIILSVYNIP